MKVIKTKTKKFTLNLKPTNLSAMRLLKRLQVQYLEPPHTHTHTQHRGSDSVNLMPFNPVNPFVPDFMLDLPTAWVWLVSALFSLLSLLPNPQSHTGSMSPLSLSAFVCHCSFRHLCKMLSTCQDVVFVYLHPGPSCKHLTNLPRSNQSYFWW